MADKLQSQQKQPWQPKAKDPLFSSAEPELYYLPGETRCKELAEFVQWFEALSKGGKSGGQNYGGVQMSDLRLGALHLMQRLQHLNAGAGDDLLFVCGEQADRCRDCIGGVRETNADEKLTKQLCLKKA